MPRPAGFHAATPDHGELRNVAYDNLENDDAYGRLQRRGRF